MDCDGYARAHTIDQQRCGSGDGHLHFGFSDRHYDLYPDGDQQRRLRHQVGDGNGDDGYDGAQCTYRPDRDGYVFLADQPDVDSVNG
jgi:hypothetical protein